MKIGDIKDREVREKALINAKNSDRYDYNLDVYEYRVETPLEEAFDWYQTPEGYDFWESVRFHECKTSDPVNPSHYKKNLFGEELKDVMIRVFGEEKYRAFAQLNAFKYRMRAGNKDGNDAAQDIEKAKWYESKL